jgi:uncharacterized protein YfaS (alpha-2-macroglobulin family)
MRRSLLLFVVLALGLGVLATAPIVRSADEAVPPQVVDTNPVRGEELAPDGSVTFYFDQAMDRPTVEGALSISPSVKGSFQWVDDSTVTFKPAAPLARQTTYSFTIASSAKSKAGPSLRDDYQLSVQTPGALLVSQVLPAKDAKDIEALPTITVIFNRPVVPLGSIDDMKKYPSPITLTPAAEGEGEWLNTTIYTFKPKGLAGGTTYTITVKKGLTDVSGSVLTADYVSKFTTVAPRVLDISPSDKKQRVLRGDKVTITFSQPMDHASTEGAFSLTGKNGAVPGDFSWNDDSTVFVFTPKNLLDYATQFTIAIDNKKALSQTGALVSDKATSAFSSISTPDIDFTQPSNGEAAQPYGGLQLGFTAPMDFKNFKTRVTIDPKPGADYDAYSNDYDPFTISVGYSTEPSASYTVTIDTTGLVDKYGTPFTASSSNNAYTIVGPNKIQIKYTTGAYPPEASLKTGSFVGLYSAYRSSTRVYATHRNIDQVDLSLSKLSLDNFLDFADLSYDTGNLSGGTFLRSWSLKVENPHNVLRYDLLSVTDQGSSGAPPPAASVNCPGAPATRLKVGATVIVLSDDPRPIRVRSSAGLNGTQIAQLPPGTQMTVVGGPVCADGYVWWKITTSDKKTTGWAAEGDSQHYFMGTSATSNGPTPVPSTNNANAPALKPGAYILSMSSPQLDGGRPINHIMLVATANITLKVAQGHLLAWVTDLQSGQPVPNVSVQFYSRPERTGALSKLDAPVKTDANGLAFLDLKTPLSTTYTAIMAVVNEGNTLGVGTSVYSEGLNAYDFGLPSDNTSMGVTAYIYTDRSLYRPGQPIYFKGIIRSRDDMKYTLAGDQTVPVEIFDDQNQSVYKKDVSVNANGSFADTFTIDPNGSLGYYRIVARPHFDPTQLSKDGYYSGPEFSRWVNVAEYRVPEFQVKATAAQSAVIQGDKIKVTVNSSFFFGGALNNAHVDWMARTQDYFFNYTGPTANANYSFLDFNEDEFTSYYENSTNEPNQIANGSGHTDAQGNFVIELPATLGKSKTSQTITVEADITDESGQVIAATVDIVVHAGEFYIGVSPRDYVGAAGKQQTVDLISVGLDSKAKPRTDLSIRVVERKWSSVQTVEPDTGRTIWDSKVDEVPVTDGVVTTDDDGKATFNFTPQHGGVYKVYATSRDSRGNQITSSGFVYIAGPDYVPWRQENSNRIDLKIDRTNYKVGDTASILIASPFQGESTALVTVERGALLKTDVIKLTTNSTVYQLPITPNMAPNVFVSVVIVKGVDDKNPVASFKMGLVQFSVETDRLKLNMTITSDKPQAGPRDTVNYTIHVTDYQNKPVKAEVGVGLTDLAVLSLLPDTSTPIMDWFYNKVGLAVNTSSTLNISVDQQTQQILSTIKGGGGGGPDNGIFQVRQRFVDTPMWQPNVMTDDNGDAKVTVTLPDNLTTWRLDARASTLPIGETNTTLVGQNIFDLISTKPLLIRPITPRFYVAGDTSTLSAIVNNNTGTDQDVTVKIDVKGATVSVDPNKTAKIGAGQRMRFDWPISVNDTDKVSVTFYASSADNKYTDAAKSAVGQGDDKYLPVIKYEVPETTGTGGTIGSDGGVQVEGVVLPRRFTVTQGSLDIRFDRSLAASAIDALDVIKNYPYQSTEWTISVMLPNIATYTALKKLGVDDPKLKDGLTQEVNYGVQRLYSDQHTDGGWGWFIEDRSDPVVTAYVLIGLNAAAKAGFDVDKSVISNGVKYLRSNIPTLGDQAPTWQLNRAAFIYYALAQVGAGDLGGANRLFSIREKMSIYARAYLILTYHILQPNTPNITTLVSDLQSRAIASATGQHWEEDFQDYYNWNSNTRSTSIVLDALVQVQPTNALIPNVVRWLMVARKADAWETTQETAWAVVALSDYMQTTGELKPDYTFDTKLNDKALGDPQTATPDNVRNAVKIKIDVADLLKDRVNILRVNRSGGAGMLYYTAHLTAYLPADQVKAVSRGLSITRSYSLANDPDDKPITQASVGDNIKVKLTIVAPNDLYYVVVTDPIPAGAEAIDPNLATTGTVGQAPALSSADPLSQGWGWWWFSKTEIRDDRTVLYATYLPAGTYEYTYTVRAGLAGTYHVIPSYGQETYFPEVYGRSDGALFTLVPATGKSDPTDTGAGG